MWRLTLLIQLATLFASTNLNGANLMRTILILLILIVSVQAKTTLDTPVPSADQEKIRLQRIKINEISERLRKEKVEMKALSHRLEYLESLLHSNNIEFTVDGKVVIKPKSTQAISALNANKIRLSGVREVRDNRIKAKLEQRLSLKPNTVKDIFIQKINGGQMFVEIGVQVDNPVNVRVVMQTLKELNIKYSILSIVKYSGKSAELPKYYQPILSTSRSTAVQRNKNSNLSASGQQAAILNSSRLKNAREIMQTKAITPNVATLQHISKLRKMHKFNVTTNQP